MVANENQPLRSQRFLQCSFVPNERLQISADIWSDWFSFSKTISKKYSLQTSIACKCNRSSDEIASVKENYRTKWYESQQRITTEIQKYRKIVKGLNPSGDTTREDIAFVCDDSIKLAGQSSRFSDGLIQSLDQLSLIPTLIDRGTISKKVCKILGKGIDTVTKAAKGLQDCQKSLEKKLISSISEASDRLKNTCAKKVSVKNILFFNGYLNNVHFRLTAICLPTTST